MNHLAFTADAIARGFATDDTGGNALLLYFGGGAFLLLAVAAAALGLLRYARHRRQPETVLLGQMRRAAGLGVADVRRLGRLARHAKVDDPATLLVMPSMLQRLRPHLPTADAECVDRVLRCLAA